MADDFVFERGHWFKGADANDVEWPGSAPWPDYVPYEREARFGLLEVPYSSSRSAEANPFHEVSA